MHPGREKRAMIKKNDSSAKNIIKAIMWLNGGRKMYDSVALANIFIDTAGLTNDLPFRAPRLITSGWEPQTIADITCYVKPGTTNSTILFLHGGGYTQRPTIFHFRFLDELHKQTGAHIVMPLYPLSPNHNFIEAYQKVTRVYQQVRFLAPTHCLTLMGDSAGGGLSLGLLMHLHELKIPEPDRLILVAPFLDINMVNPLIKDIEPRDRMLGSIGLIEFGKRWAAGHDTYQYRLSPIYGDLSIVRQIMIVAGTQDILFPDAELLKNKLTELGKDVVFIKGEDMPHDYPLIPLPEAKIATEKIAEYIKSHPCLIKDVGHPSL